MTWKPFKDLTPDITWLDGRRMPCATKYSWRKNKTTFPSSESVERKEPYLHCWMWLFQYVYDIYRCRRVKGLCLSNLQVVVTGHPDTEEDTDQGHCHDCDDCCCIHCSNYLKVCNVRFDGAKVRLYRTICNQWLWIVQHPSLQEKRNAAIEIFDSHIGRQTKKFIVVWFFQKKDLSLHLIWN